MGTTIQDGGKRERSNGRRLDWKIGIKNDNKDKSIKRRWVADRERTGIKEREYMLENEELRVEIIWLHYNVPVARHREQ